VILFLYLDAVGLDERRIGLLLTLTLLGDTAVSLWITTRADRHGRRRMLIIGALLMAGAGAVFALTGDFWLLLIAATVGVISPSGNEVGPFLSVEQASLAHIVPAERRTAVFAWYSLCGSLATAAGALCGGGAAQLAQALGAVGADIYRPVVIGYAVIGLLLGLAFTRLSPAIEVETPAGAGAAEPARARLGQDDAAGAPAGRTGGAAEPPPRSRLGLHRSLGVVLRLSGLFALDAFGGGFVIQSVVAYWFHLRFGTEPATLGAIFFGANVFAGVSALSASWLARRIGLVNTMVFTHLPSNVLLLLVPLMPTEPLAVTVLLLRFAISQMDVPTRQSYTVAVVSPEERSAASGVTGVARSVGAAASPVLATALMANPVLLGVPFFLAGGIKIVYDVLLYRMFVAIRPPEEQKA
jgi:MFS family permease